MTCPHKPGAHSMQMQPALVPVQAAQVAALMQIRFLFPQCDSMKFAVASTAVADMDRKIYDSCHLSTASVQAQLSHVLSTLHVTQGHATHSFCEGQPGYRSYQVLRCSVLMHCRRK